MAITYSITRSIFFSKSSSILNFRRLFFHSSTPSPPRIFSFTTAKIPKPPSSILHLTRLFCNPSEISTPKKPNPKLVNFSLPSDSESDSETTDTKQVIKPNLPPPYDPFNKKPAIEEPNDPKNLQEVFAKIREDGLMNSAVKMFDGLSQDGLTHEALELFSQIKDKGQMPDVVAHTAVLEAYASAGQVKEAHKVYLKMLMSGVLPNAYTYKVLIKALAESGDMKMVKDAKKCVGEMVERGMKPNAGICVKVFEELVNMGLDDQGMKMVEILKEKGAVPEENTVRDVLKNKRGSVYRNLMSILYEK